MLFNSYAFLLVFLPITWLVFCALLHSGMGLRVLIGWLALASCLFYAYWNPPLLALPLLSIAMNHWLSQRLHGRHGKAWLVVGIVVNLALLAWFKYAGFISVELRALGLTSIPELTALLPLGISFFTFQQITYLVDVRERVVAPAPADAFLLFVMFFPHLIAGPIVHPRVVLPQFASRDAFARYAECVPAALALLSMGLAKKLLLADSLAEPANAMFEAARIGPVTLGEAWLGSLAYTFQLYFDFSGYSDMAIALALLFGIRLPANFNSPYRALSIIDFWRRWHMTLSALLRDYLYKRLGGSRKGTLRRYVNLMLTMLLGGLWHGAGWNFIVWGGLHGSYLVLNHLWRGPAGTRRMPAGLGWLLTFLAVLVGWVWFRAANPDTAWRVLAAMTGAAGVDLPRGLASALAPVAQWGGWDLRFQGLSPSSLLGDLRVVAVGLAAGFAISLLLPSTTTLFAHVTGAEPLAGGSRLAFRPTLAWAVFAALCMALSLLSLGRVQEFLYFQF